MTIEQIPKAYRALYLRSAAAECSPRQAIKAKCQECVGYEDVIERVSECSTQRCPLWRYRPYQVSRAAKGDAA